MPHESEATPFPGGRRTRRAREPGGRDVAERDGAEAPTVVWKFGGSSVADADRLRAVAGRMVRAHRSGRRVVAVLSAMGTTTTELDGRARALSSGPPLRELDALLASGEAVSCALTAIAVQELGVPAVSLNAAQAGIRTDDRHVNARLRHVRPGRIVRELDAGAIVLVTGFQGVSDNDDVTTLGRGGSDASAVAVAAALGLDQCEIFTDVRGVFTADPRLVTDARPLASIRHEEMLELAEGGAGVLQPRSVDLAATHGIDVHLRSSFGDADGTWIRQEPPTPGSVDVAGIAHRAEESLYALSGTSPAVLAAALAERGAAVGVLSTHEHEVRFTAPSTSAEEVAAAVGGGPGRLRVHEETGSVSVVSSGIARRPEIPARALDALDGAGITPRLVTSTPGRVCLHVSSARVPDAVRCLHEVFIARAEPGTGADDVAIQDLSTAGGRRTGRTADPRPVGDGTRYDTSEEAR